MKNAANRTMKMSFIGRFSHAFETLGAREQHHHAGAVHAPGCAIDAVVVAIERHQCVVGQRGDDGTFQVVGNRQ